MDSGKSSKEVYDKIGQLAIKSGTIISLISICSEDCKLDLLSPCTLNTSGNILKINPVNLSSNFSDFLSEKIMAFDATIIVRVHKALKFIGFKSSELSFNSSILTKKLGNILPSQAFNFEYELKSLEELEKEGINPEDVKVVPFQGSLKYIGDRKSVV